MLMQIVIMWLHRAMYEFKDFATIIEELILILRESKHIFTTKRQYFGTSDIKIFAENLVFFFQERQTDVVNIPILVRNN